MANKHRRVSEEYRAAGDYAANRTNETVLPPQKKIVAPSFVSMPVKPKFMVPLPPPKPAPRPLLLPISAPTPTPLPKPAPIAEVKVGGWDPEDDFLGDGGGHTDDRAPSSAGEVDVPNPHFLRMVRYQEGELGEPGQSSKVGYLVDLVKGVGHAKVTVRNSGKSHFHAIYLRRDEKGHWYDKLEDDLDLDLDLKEIDSETRLKPKVWRHTALEEAIAAARFPLLRSKE